MSIEVLRRQLAELGLPRTRGRRPSRVVVIGNVGNGNTGDEALLATALRILDPDAQVTVLSRNPQRVTALHRVAAAPMTALGASPALARCDALVVVGGGMFGPGPPPLVRMLPYLVAAAAHAGRDTAYVGIGTYPGMPRSTLSALRRSAAYGRGVTVRDDVSAQLLNPEHPPPCVGDLASYLPAASDTEAVRTLAAVGVDPTRPLLLLAPKAGTSADKTRRLLDASGIVARHWAALGGAVAGVALSDRADYGIDPAQTDAALIADISRATRLAVPTLGPDLHPALAKAIVGRATAVLGLRFHAMVFAMATGVPCLGFPWEPKTAALLEEAGLPAVTDPVDHGQLTTWLDGTLAGPSPPTVNRGPAVS